MATVKDLAAYVCDKLAGKVLIHRYDAYSTNSVYLKFDYGLGNSLRLSDHTGKAGLNYRFNMDLYNNRLVIACCVDPNFKDADLQAKYGVMGAEALIDVLLKPGQFVDLLLSIQEINGFTADDVNDLREEAKN